ncbi:MAG: phosphoesterase [Lachnospiraceae bacterium]|jgi:membrane-associated phospholipid phosphatase|nr:phosphoesterase [Lachnospiraceae bacterium]
MGESIQRMKQRYGHAWVLSYFGLYVPYFFYLERNIRSDYYNIHLRLDDLIPFNEYFIIPYLLWFVYMAAAICYFFFADRGDYYRLCAFLFIGMTVCMVVCTIFPNGTDLRVWPDPGKNIFARLVWLLHGIDTSTNIFPSIHAFNSIGVHLAVTHSRKLSGHTWARWVSGALAVSVILSTVFLKQHSVLDILGAGFLAYCLYPFIYGGLHPRARHAHARAYRPRR